MIILRFTKLSCGIRVENQSIGAVFYKRQRRFFRADFQGYDIFANNLPGNLGLIDTKLDVHCVDGESLGKVEFPLKDNIRLTNTYALAINGSPDF